jgi:hypothetical protein
MLMCLVVALSAELNATPEYARNPLTPQYYLAELARPEEMQVTVAQQDFELALRELVPSVSEAGGSCLLFFLDEPNAVIDALLSSIVFTEMLHYKVVQVCLPIRMLTDKD